MILRLIALSALLTSVASVPVSTKSPRPKDLQIFTSRVMIASVPDPDLNPLDQNVFETEFYMRGGQCTGRIPKSSLCGEIVPLALQVTLKDSVNYPRIFIDRDVNFVDILRMPNDEGVCEYGVDVNLLVQCLGLDELRRSGRPQRVTLSEVPASI